MRINHKSWRDRRISETPGFAPALLAAVLAAMVVVALGKPSDRDRTEWYFQRYTPYLPATQEMVLFNRSWYDRAGVERVMGFCSDDQYHEFLEIDALVYGTGGNTYFGRTAHLVESAHTASHFRKAVLKIGDFLIVIAVAPR